jgi:hypothetical protein
MDQGTDLVYRVRTEGDLKAFEEAKKALVDQKKAYEELGKSTVEVDRQLKRVEATLDSQTAKSVKVAEAWNKAIEKIRSAGGNVDSMVAERNSVLQQGGLKAPGKFTEAFSAFRGAGGGLEGIKEAAGVFGKGPLAAAAVGVGAIEASTEALKEYAKAEQAIVGLDAAMAQRGLLSDENRKRFQELATDMEHVTAIAKGDWINVIQRLVQFGGRPEDMQKSVEGVKNLAGILDGDLQSAALHVGKALSGNFEAFSRLGIQFDEHMTQTQKLAKLWEELAARGGGQLEARADTLAGAWKRFKNGTSDVLESFGHIIASVVPVQAVLYGLGTSLSYVAEKFGFTIAKSNELKNAHKLLADSAADADASAKTFTADMEKQKQAIDGTTAALANYLSKLNEQAGNRKNEIDAKFGLDNAILDKQLKDGKITPQQAAVRKAQLEIDRDRAKADIDSDVREKSKSQIQGAMAGDAESVKQKEEAEKAAKERVKNLEMLQKQREKFEKELDRNIDNAQAEVEKHDRATDESGRHQAELNVEKKKREKEAALKQFDDEYHTDPATIGKARQDAKRAEDEAAATRKSVGDANEERNRQFQTIDEAEASQKRVRENNEKAQRIRAGMAIQDAGTPGQTAQPGAPGTIGGTVTDDEFKKHVPKTQADAKRLEDSLSSAHKYFEAVSTTLSKATNLTEKQAKVLENAIARMKDLDHKIEIVEAQIANMPSR